MVKGLLCVTLLTATQAKPNHIISHEQFCSTFNCTSIYIPETTRILELEQEIKGKRGESQEIPKQALMSQKG